MFGGQGGAFGILLTHVEYRQGQAPFFLPIKELKGRKSLKVKPGLSLLKGDSFIEHSRQAKLSIPAAAWRRRVEKRTKNQKQTDMLFELCWHGGQPHGRAAPA